MEKVLETKVMLVDKFEVRSSSAPASSHSQSPPPTPKPPATPPPPPLLPVQRQKQRRRLTTYQNVSREKKAEVTKTGSSPLASMSPTTTPPPPPPLIMPHSEEEYVSIERKKSKATKETNIVLASTDNQKQKAKTIYDDSSFRTPPPWPPPPPSVFCNLFNCFSESKVVHSVPTISTLPLTSCSAPTNYKDRYENFHSGGRLPLIPMPPPPPPPFRMLGMKFAVRGDNVSIQSSSSSSCHRSSPELLDVYLSSTKETSDGMDGVDMAGPSVFCRSPDVNIKADTFIARLRDKSKLEKINGLVHLGED